MTKILMRSVLLIALLVICLSASSTYVGEGLAGYLLIHLAIVLWGAYSLPRFRENGRRNFAYLAEIILGAVGVFVFVWFGLSVSMENPVSQRIGVWIILSSLILLGMGISYLVLPWILKHSVDEKNSVSEPPKHRSIESYGIMDENAV